MDYGFVRIPDSQRLHHQHKSRSSFPHQIQEVRPAHHRHDDARRNLQRSKCRAPDRIGHEQNERAEHKAHRQTMAVVRADHHSGDMGHDESDEADQTDSRDRDGRQIDRNEGQREADPVQVLPQIMRGLLAQPQNIGLPDAKQRAQPAGK